MNIKKRQADKRHEEKKQFRVQWFPRETGTGSVFFVFFSQKKVSHCQWRSGWPILAAGFFPPKAT
jgi:hypothetical protein